MTLRNKTLTILFLASAGLILTLFFGFRGAVRRDFATMESEVLRQSAARVAVVFLNELLALDTNTSAWANWDEMAAFVDGSAPDFPNRYLVPQKFNSLGVSVIAMMGLDGRLVWSGGRDPRQDRPAAVPTAVESYLRSVLARRDQRDYLLTRGLVMADPHPLLVATRPIRNNEGGGADRGVLLFARPLDPARVAEWGEFVSLQLDVSRLDQPPLPPDCERALAMMSKRDQLAVIPISEAKIAAYALLKDVDQRAALVVRGVQPRDIHAQAEQVVNYLGLMVLIAVLFFSLTMLMLLERAVLSRLARLNADIAQIGATGDLGARVTADGQDEISQLGEALNGMLAAVQRSQTDRAESEARFRAVITQTTEGILVADGETMKLLDANPAFLELAGYASPDLPSMTLDDLLGPAAEALHQYLDEAEEDADRVVEVSFGRPDGVPVEVEIKANRIVYAGRRAICAVVRDVTGRREAEEERRAFEQQMLHTQKLESLGVLAGGIAHDFNNLLTGILGNAALAMHHLPPDAPMRKYVERIETTSTRAADLVAQMLAYAGKGQFAVKPLNLADVVSEMADLLHVSVSKLALLEVDGDERLPLIMGDPTQLRQVVMNLITNASDALAGRPGTIRLCTTVKDMDREELLRAHCFDRLDEGRYVSVEVTDDGIGMDEATQARIFDPFFTTKFTGRGLGLAAVLGIVRAHGGAIRVASQPGQGTTVEVLLPVAPRDVQMPESPLDEWRAAAEWGRDRTVLIVDDEPDVAEVAQAILEQAGCQVLVAEDGVNAIETLRRREGQVDVVLLDLTMPGMSGVEVLAEIHRRWPALPVVMSSGYPQPVGGDGGALAGLSGFVQKPYQPATLLRHLAEASTD